MKDFFDLKFLITLLLLLVGFLITFLFTRQKRLVYEKQEKELQMYKMYVKPLEDFIREIRAKQHEFDNHLNAILNMHLTIQNYDELVKAQSDYMHALVKNRDTAYLGLLKISNKVLAGFLYSKLISIPKTLDIELIVGNKEVFSNVPELELVEVIGTLIDNAVQACENGKGKLKIYLTSEHDRLVFIIKNSHEKIPVTQLSKFFERGFTTKEDNEGRGYGLYNARKIINQWNGEITVENEEIGQENYLSFHIEL